MDWEGVRCFVTIARHESLSDGARSLGISVATAARRIDALEASLGLKLIRRTPRGTLITPDGSRIYELAELGERHMSRIAKVALGLREGAPLEAVRISSTETMISSMLAPRIGEILAEIPGIRIEFDVDKALSDLNRGNVDIAIRLSKPAADNLVARRLPRIDLKLYCAPAYLRRGIALTVPLHKHCLIWFDTSYGDIDENQWLRKHALEAAAQVRSASFKTLETACVMGVGIAPLPVFMARNLGLVEVPSPPLPTREPWIVFHRDTRSNQRLKQVRDWIERSCRDAVGEL